MALVAQRIATTWTQRGAVMTGLNQLSLTLNEPETYAMDRRPGGLQI